MSAVTIVHSSVANIGSVAAAFERAGAAVTISRDWEEIRRAPRVVLPGVGAARPAMQELERLGLRERLPTLTQPVLGVCLGMQLMFRHSAEGEVDCLSIFDSDIAKLPAQPGLRLPHMGWNRLKPLRQHPLIEGLGASDFAYFVHGYAAPVDAHTLMACTHGQRFAAIVARGNFMGAQFHPERSAQVGARLLANFLRLDADLLSQGATS